VDQSSGGKKNCTVYSFFYLFFSIIVINVIISSISFIALLNCLYLNPRVFPFVHFSFPYHCRGKGRGQ